MHVFRISGKKYIFDLSGEGAKRNGGRWNRPGVAVLYTGSNPSVCAMEYWVHLKNKIRPKENHYGKITIAIPDDSVQQIQADDLPSDWHTNPEALFKLTDDWLSAKVCLCLKVPSVASPGDWNYLINPDHELAKQGHVTIVGEPTDYSFDERMFNRQLVNEKTLGELVNEALSLLGLS